MEPNETVAPLIRAEGAALRDTPWGPIALDFGDWEAEFRALRNSAAMFCPPSVAQIELTGSDRAKFLNNLTTNQVDRLKPGEGCETFLCDSNGRILHHLFVFAGAESLVLHAGGGTGPSLCMHLDYYLIREDVQIHDRSRTWGELILFGPHARDIVSRLTSADLPGGDISTTTVSWQGHPLMIRHINEPTLPQFYLAGEAAIVAPLWQAVRQLGARLCGVRAVETARIEVGFPVIGRDISEKSLPQEVGRAAKTISFTKGCYLGQEIVARIDSRDAVRQLLRGLRFASMEVPPDGGALTHQGQTAGSVTSAAYSPSFGVAVAIGNLRRAYSEPGTILDSDWGPATVAAFPMTE